MGSSISCVFSMVVSFPALRPVALMEPGGGWAARRWLFFCINYIQPTGNLDSKNSRDVMELLTQASRHYQQTILMITHNRNLTASVDRVFQVADGVLTDLGGEADETLS